MNDEKRTDGPELIESGVDYLTATCNRDRAGRKLAALCDSLLLQEKGQGNMIKDWRWEGYKGYQCGSLQTGVRHDGMIARLSSHVAYRHAEKVVQLATNVSRIDLQVTVRLPDEKSDLSSIFRRQAIAYKRAHQTRLAVTAIRTDKEGNTLYLGKRASDLFFRCYDKHRETKLDHYNKCWRNELETKGGRAKLLWEKLREGERQESLAQSVIAGYLNKRGIRSRWLSADPQQLVVPLSSTNVLDTLRWFGGQVSKRVKWMIENGHGPEALKALGLSEEILLDVIEQMHTPRRLEGGMQHGTDLGSYNRATVSRAVA